MVIRDSASGCLYHSSPAASHGDTGFDLYEPDDEPECPKCGGSISPDTFFDTEGDTWAIIVCDSERCGWAINRETRDEIDSETGEHV